MKKFICVILVLISVLNMDLCAFADTFKNKLWGIEFEVPQGFNQVLLTDTTVMYASQDGFAHISVFAETSTEAYFEDAYTKEIFAEAFETLYCAENISSALSDINKMHITASLINNHHSEKIINDVWYAVYDAQFELHVYGMENQKYSLSAYATAKNGRVYTVLLEKTMPSEYTLESFVETFSYELGEIKIIVNGEKLISDTPAAAIDGRILVPIRAVAEKLDYSVKWDDVNSTVTLISNEDQNQIVFTLNSLEYSVNTESYTLDVPAIAFNERTYIPLRAATEAMGASVQWIQETVSAEIVK